MEVSLKCPKSSKDPARYATDEWQDTVSITEECDPGLPLSLSLLVFQLLVTVTGSSFKSEVLQLYGQQLEPGNW